MESLAIELAQHRILSPQWEADVKSSYFAPNTNSCDFYKTFFGRHSAVNMKIRELLLNMPQRINTLVVGVGRDDPARYACASEPFELAGILEGLNKDYQMTILELSIENLEAAKTNDTVFLKPLPYSHTSGEDRKVWLQYLTDTSQIRDVDIAGDEPLIADIPRSFKTKRDTKDIKFVNGDIVLTDLTPYGPFNLIQCYNIFVHLHDNEHTTSDSPAIADNAMVLAIYNMIRNLSTPGIFAVDDYHPLSDGWEPRVLDKLDKLEAKLGIRLLHCIGWSSKHDYLIYTKT